MRGTRQQVHDVVNNGLDGEINALDLEHSGCDLGEVEDVVDNGHERLPRALHRLCIVALAFVELRLEQEIGHGDDPVHRGTDLMAHVGEEVSLGFRRLVGQEPVTRFAEVQLPVLERDPACRHESRLELVGRTRLHDVVLRSRPQECDHLRAFRARREDDDRDPSGGGRCLERCQHAPAVAVGQAEVEEDDVGDVASRQFARLEASGRLRHGPTPGTQGDPHGESQVSVVLDQQDPGGHLAAGRSVVRRGALATSHGLLGPVLHRATRRVARRLGKDVGAKGHSPRIREPVGKGDVKTTGRRWWRCLATDVACTSMELAAAQAGSPSKLSGPMMISQGFDDRGASPSRAAQGERPGDQHTMSGGAWCPPRPAATRTAGHAA